MRDFLLDTQTIRYWYDTKCSEHAAVIGNVAALRQSTASFQVKPKLLVSVITLGEIEFGHRVALASDPALQATYTKFVGEELPYPFDLSQDAADAYGELRMRLFNKYAPGEKRKPKMRPEQLLDPVTARELQIARSVFPTGLASKIIVTFNLRTWRHFFIMRTSKEAHPQMKQVTLPLLRDFQERIPILFEDIIPEQRQAEMMRLLR